MKKGYFLKHVFLSKQKQCSFCIKRIESKLKQRVTNQKQREHCVDTYRNNNNKCVAYNRLRNKTCCAEESGMEIDEPAPAPAPAEAESQAMVIDAAEAEVREHGIDGESHGVCHRA